MSTSYLVGVEDIVQGLNSVWKNIDHSLKNIMF